MRNKEFAEWLTLRARLLTEERSFARERQGLERGELTDLQSLSIKQSEIRALRALSRAIVRRVFCETKSHPTFSDSRGSSA